MLEKCMISGFADEIDISLEKQIALLHSIGQKFIEFRAADGVGVANHSIEDIRRVKARLDKAGIKVSSLGSPIGKISILDDFGPHFESFQHVVNLAREMDTKSIRMFSFFIPKGQEPEQYEDEVFARMERMVTYAKEYDVVLLHENEKNIYGDIAGRCLKLMERFYGDNFKCVFDFANFVQCGQDTLEAYEMLKPYIAYIHVKDAKAAEDEVVLPGTGDGNLKKIFSMLDQDGYEGFLSLEPHLVNFSTLNSLEHDVKERKLSDGAAAYVMAHDTLMKLLR